MAGYTKQLVAEGYLSGDPETLGKIFWAMVHGLVMLHLTGRLDPKPDFATLHQTAMRLLARGAGAAVQSTKRRASLSLPFPSPPFFSGRFCADLFRSRRA